jgi:galactokinase
MLEAMEGPASARGGGVAGVAPAAQALEEHVQSFERAFGRGGTVRAFFSPGRVNLMGAHLDYNGGPVMPMAIDRGTFLAVRERSDDQVRLRSTSEEGEFRFHLASPPASRAGRWSDYPSGVIRGLAGRGAGRGLEFLFGGNLPVGAGLSSSASICVGTAFALDRVWDLGLGPDERVQAALDAERGFVGVQCGIMDPYAVGLARPGHLLWLDCKDASWEHLPIDHGVARVAVADTLVRRELAQGAFNQRVEEASRAFRGLQRHAPEATCLRDVGLEVLERHGGELEPILRARATHVLHEVRRTFQAREALLAGDLPSFGRRMLESHASLRDLYDVSVPELDCLVESAAVESGVLGARLTGAGFGGCAVILLERGGEPALDRVREAFARRFGREPRIELFGGDSGPRELATFES